MMRLRPAVRPAARDCARTDEMYQRAMAGLGYDSRQDERAAFGMAKPRVKILG